MDWDERWVEAKGALFLTWTVGMACKLVDALLHVDGWAWQVLRLSLVVLFIAALLFWLVALVQHKVRGIDRPTA